MPLADHVGVISACPKHGINLVEKCVCGPESKLPLISAKRLPGICMLCGGKLSSETTRELQKAEEREIQRSQMVAEFIRDRRLVENIAIGSNHKIIEFIRGIINNHTNGKASEFAKMLFLYKSQVSDWLKELHTPVFQQIVSIAQACGCSIADVYLGKYQHIEKVSPLYHSNRKPISVPKKRKTAFKNVTEFQLNSFLGNKKPISLTQVAKKLNVSKKFLRRHFKDISLKIVDNYQKKRKTAAETRLSEKCREYRKTAETLFANGINPTRRRMVKELDVKMLIRHRKVFTAIVNEVKQAASKPT
jgi:transcriptional regulator with XRE-family HTH domain